MSPADIRIVALSPDTLDAWLQAVPPSAEGTDNTCQWITLSGRRPVDVRTLPGGPATPTIILYQVGAMTPPEAVWPMLACPGWQASARHLPLNVVLTGDHPQASCAAWTDWITLTTPGQPPLFRLLLRLGGLALPASLRHQAGRVIRRYRSAQP